MCISCHKEIYLPWNRNVNRNKPGHVYMIQSPHGLVKIGITTKVKDRLSALQVETGLRLILLASVQVQNAGKYERVLHTQFKAQHSHGEWFALTQEQIEQAKEFLCRAK